MAVVEVLTLQALSSFILRDRGIVFYFFFFFFFFYLIKLAQCHKTETKPETLLFQCFLSVLGTSGTAVILTPRQEYNLAPAPIPIEADTKYANTDRAAQPKPSCQLPLRRNHSPGMGQETRAVPLSRSELSNLGKKRTGTR